MTFSPGDAITFAWERVKADPGTILGGIIVALLLSFVVAFTVSFAVNLVSAAVGVASSVAVSPGRHRVPDSDGGPLPLRLRDPRHRAAHPVGHHQHRRVELLHRWHREVRAQGRKGRALRVRRRISGGQFFLSVLVAQFITSFAVGFGLLLLIVPGVIIAIGLCMTTPLIVDRNFGPIEALGESWKLTEGNRVNLFIFGLIAFGLVIAGSCACGVGLLLVMPLLWISWFYIYLRMSGQQVAQIARAA